ncbi:MAG: hypothetical protein MJ010_00390 [Paludibacteraceae bacterium]|nr:hypothetical protein [Paludibacteraceae bacterium]
MKKLIFALLVCTVLPVKAQGTYFGVTPKISSDGVMEIGKYIDFHEQNPSDKDYNARLYSSSDILITDKFRVNDVLYLRNDNNVSLKYEDGRLKSSKPMLINRSLSIPSEGAVSDEAYHGNIILCKPKDKSGQYINMINNGRYSWSIGMVYGTCIFAIGKGTYKEEDFTNPAFAIHNNQNVGIGTIHPDERLTVNGTVHAKEVRIDLQGPLADYVFDEEYKLRPLSEVSGYVKENKHLPDVPSAQEVGEKGISVGEMQNTLLKKIEELTLYIIQQQKEIDNLKKQLNTK